MNFINLQVFWWIPVILVFMGLLFWRARVRRTSIMRLILGPRAKDDMHVQLSLARRLFRFLLLLFVMLMLIVAIARPTWKLQLVPYQTRGRDLMVLFDVSKSMLAQDIKPSRMAHAKLFLRDLVYQTGSDRFGLVAFAGRAFLECPMTTDKTSFIQYIDELDTESIPLGGTNLQLALETAMKAFDAAEGNNRAIILITDGDELTGNSKLALGELKKAKIPLLIVGVGSSAVSAPVPIPQKDGKSVKFMRDAKGELVKTRLNAALMQQLADSTGGYFIHSTTTDFGLEEIEAGIKKLLPAELEKGEKTRPVERFYYFLAFATIILWLWMLISEHPGKKRNHVAKTAAISIVLTLLFLQNTADAQTPEKALPKLPAQQQEIKKPEAPVTDPVKAYNKAREIQLKKQKGDSAKLYETAINLAGKNPAVRTNSFNNLGVEQHQKARQSVAQGIAQVRQQNLDGAISQLEGAKKILNLAEEMYIKALSSEIPEIPDKDKEIAQKIARNQSAVNQQLLLNDRVMIDELIKKIKELKKQQKKAQKQTQKAQKQQQQKNQQQQNKQQQNKQQQKKQKQNKQQQNKQQQNKQQQNKQQQNKQQQNKQQQKKQQQNKQQQNKQQQNKQQQNKQQQKKQQQNKQQQKKTDDELKKAQNDVKKLENQAKDLGQKKIEEQAKKAKQELDKAEKSREKKQGKKAEEHIKKALEQLKPQNPDKNKKQKDKKGKGKNQKDKKNQQKKDKKKDQGKNGKDKKDKNLPKPQPQQAKAAKAEKAPKDIDPKEARKLLKLMTEKEKDFRKALKAHQKQQYENIKVEKDW